MKTKMFKKLIAAVCALTMITSCAAMSVGAVPANIEQGDWKQGFNRAMQLQNRAFSVYQTDGDLQECSALADELEEFFNSMICTAVVYGPQSEVKDTALGLSLYWVLTQLRSDDSAQRKLGANRASYYLTSVEIEIIKHIQQ